ncbi:MAG: 30S ribosomal protein S17 [Gemmatimonadales bacterium]|jgi:small subunit ribosomal protein S17
MTQETSTRSQRKMRTGVVIGDKMDKTVVVQLTRQFSHTLYGKQIKRTKRVKAHDEHDAKRGDTVRIMEVRPLSKTKRWRVVEIVTRAE